MLKDSKEAVLAKNVEVAVIDLPEEAAEQLVMRATDGLNFFNTSLMDLSKLGKSDIQANLIFYIQGFSKDAREIFQYFNFAEFIGQLGDANLLYQVVQRIRQIDLNPKRVSNHDMGLAFEKLICRFAEGSNEGAGSAKAKDPKKEFLSQII